jgi:hypothetical protein
VNGLAPILAWSPLTKDFGSVNVGLTSSTQTFTLTNSGTAAATGCSAPELDNDTDFTITTDNCGTSDVASSSGSCTVIVQANPTQTGVLTATLSRTCTYGGTVATTADEITVTGYTNTSVSVAPIYPTNGANWNDYVRNYGSGTSAYDRDDTACVGTENGYYQCLHGGEKKKVVVTGFTACTDLSATDTLGAFDWECVVQGGTATMVSKGLKSGHGLRDLIDPAGSAFAANRVIVMKAGYTPPVAESPLSTTWWTNTVTPLPDNHLGTDSVVALTGTSTIYTLTASRDTMGYNMDAAKQSLVTLGSAVLSDQAAIVGNCDDGGNLSPAYKYVVCDPGKDYLWVEAAINARNSDALYLSYGSGTDTHFARVHRTTISGGGNYNSDTLTSSLISDFSVEGVTNESAAVELWHNLYDTYLNVHIANSVDRGLNFDCSSDRNVFQNLTISSTHSTGGSGNGIAFGTDCGGENYENVFTNVVVNGSGLDAIQLADADTSALTKNTFHAVTLLNSATDGLAVGGDTNTFTNLVSANNGGAGVTVYGDGNIFVQIATADNAGNAFQTTGTAGSNSFQGVLLKDSGGTCSNAGSGGGNLLDNSCDYGTGLGSTMGTVDLTDTFLGKVLTDDASNSSDTDGAATYALTMDWLNFENLFRGWGKDDPALFPSPNHRGACVSGTCRIWDARISYFDTALKDHNGAFVAGATCPASVSGADATKQVTDGAGHTYLLNAVEIIGDGIGNENGLCESDEACIYAPNLGAYQGEGDYTSQTCTFADGTLSGVTMYAYPTNGAGKPSTPSAAPTIDAGFPLTISTTVGNFSSSTFNTVGPRTILVAIGGATTGDFAHQIKWTGGTPTGATAFTQVSAAYFNDGWNIWGEWWMATASQDLSGVSIDYDETLASSGGDGLVMAVYSVAGSAGLGAVKANDQLLNEAMAVNIGAHSEKSLILGMTYREDQGPRSANTDLQTGCTEDANLTDNGSSAYDFVHYFTTSSGTVPVGYSEVVTKKWAVGIELLGQ